MRLEEASDHQRNQIERATGTVQTMSQAMNDMASEAKSSAETRPAVGGHHGRRGGSTVRRTIAGMDNIREQIRRRRNGSSGSVRVRRRSEISSN